MEVRDGWDVEYAPDIHNERIPGALDLGFYYNEDNDQIQVAKVPQSDRATHLYVVGATGTGKTKFLEFLIRQDVANGHGFGVIDPHGDLIEDIKGFLACRYCFYGDEGEVSERVVLVDPTDCNYTVTFNPLERIPGVSVAEQAGELVSSFKKIWSDSWGVRMEDLMRNSLIALGEAELTLCELTPFLTRRGFRQVALEKVENPTAQDYFRRFDTLTDRAQITWIEPVMNKINAFLADDRMRQMFSSARSSFHLREVMDTSKHLLIKLDKGKLKGSADLLGSLFMAKIQMTAFSRSGIPQHQRVPFYLYIDEFQNFASESFEIILSEARKYGLSLVMAHQSLSQIPDDLRGLILASAGLQVYFRVNRQDASLLAKEVFQYSGYEVKSEGVSRPVYWSYAEEWEHKTSDLQHLPPRVCYAKHKIQGGSIQLHTVEIEPPWETLEITEDEYLQFAPSVPFGWDYLRLRDQLLAEARERQLVVEQEAKHKASSETEATAPDAQVCETSASTEETEPRTTEEPSISSTPTCVPAEQPSESRSRSRAAAPQPDPSGERDHRRLQHLIKRLAEEAGYRATIEQPTNDGDGRVDVALVRDGVRSACEVSVTTSADHELDNILKCLASGYDRVILCSPNKKTLSKTKALCSTSLSLEDQQKTLFLGPEELVTLFEEEAARSAGKVETVNGYKVKVNFQPVESSEKAAKRQAIAQVILKSFQRQKRS